MEFIGSPQPAVGESSVEASLLQSLSSRRNNGVLSITNVRLTGSPRVKGPEASSVNGPLLTVAASTTRNPSSVRNAILAGNLTSIGVSAQGEKIMDTARGVVTER